MVSDMVALVFVVADSRCLEDNRRAAAEERNDLVSGTRNIFSSTSSTATDLAGPGRQTIDRLAREGRRTWAAAEIVDRERSFVRERKGEREERIDDDIEERGEKERRRRRRRSGGFLGNSARIPRETKDDRRATKN